jgi:hypothetical protein
MFLRRQHQIVSAPKYSRDTDSESAVSKLGIYIAPEMPFSCLVSRWIAGALRMAATEALVELQKLRETAESLRRVAVGLPAELRAEIERVARQLDDEAEDLEVKLRSL